MGEISDTSGAEENSLAHGFRARARSTTAKTVTMDAKGTETHGYKPSASEARPATPAKPPPPPTGNGGGSK